MSKKKYTPRLINIELENGDNIYLHSDECSDVELTQVTGSRSMSLKTKLNRQAAITLAIALLDSLSPSQDEIKQARPAPETCQVTVQ